MRITVQLINAADGFHLWSESYDRELNDIFAVQEDIGKSVAESLKVSLLRAGATKSPAHSKNIEAYKAFDKRRPGWIKVKLEPEPVEHFRAA